MRSLSTVQASLRRAMVSSLHHVLRPAVASFPFRRLATIPPQPFSTLASTNSSWEVSTTSEPHTSSKYSENEVSDQMFFNVGRPVGGERGDFVRVVEVGPRDGLQNEKVISKDDRAKLIKGLLVAGLKTIEAGSFVHHSWVPQMDGTDTVLTKIGNMNPDVHLPVYVPNMRGFGRLLKAIQWDEYKRNANIEGEILCDEITVTVNCTETFSFAHEALNIREHIESLREVISLAISYGFRVRAHLAVAIECPFEGPVPASRVADLAQEMVEMGCYEVALADTTGRGDPVTVRNLIETVAARIGVDRISGHFHDTFGLGLSNVLTALSLGVRSFDSAVGGLGSCPYSPGAAGNIATEDIVYTLHNLGYHTGVNIVELAKVGGWVSEKIPRENASRAGKAILSRIAWEEDADVKRLRAEHFSFWQSWVIKKRLGLLAILFGLATAAGAWKWQKIQAHPAMVEAGLRSRMAQDLITDALSEMEDTERPPRTENRPSGYNK
ncbi:Hydroxymethylglutaryl-CoA lyase [Phaffia rhodozyma]|uniref:hydroxymethylglutaryl-CoA lyase n=1 Tax=Phaffia rhodozyma TaxID=264483 RepID=A0A0F7SEA4_PHARH|nr:Hydroxymethylglutaryl-CoA lyase [Phaffia rhodozyma]